MPTISARAAADIRSAPATVRTSIRATAFRAVHAAVCDTWVGVWCRSGCMCCNDGLWGWVDARLAARPAAKRAVYGAAIRAASTAARTPAQTTASRACTTWVAIWVGGRVRGCCRASGAVPAASADADAAATV